MKNKKRPSSPQEIWFSKKNYRHYQTKGTKVIFTPEETFKNYKFRMEYVVKMIKIIVI
jgi:hypothetical protein